MTLLLGLVGKPSSGKSTFLNASCLTEAEVSELPFTTIEPNKGVAYLRTECVCGEFDVEDDPQNSLCIDGYRFIPIHLLDVAGLVPDAHKGKGLGNQFLNDLSRADVLIHIVDATGSLNEAGQRIGEGQHDPYQDIRFLEDEIDLWYKEIVMREDWKKFADKVKKNKKNFIDALYNRLSGLKVSRLQIKMALKRTELTDRNPMGWNDEELTLFSKSLRKISKPIIISANKIDKPVSIDNFKALREKYTGKVIPSSALAEHLLRKYNEENIIDYIPGSNSFKITEPSKLSSKEKATLDKIDERILKKFGGTGIQKLFKYAIFDILNQIPVYPVSDANKLTDNNGNILPDVYLVEKETTLREFVRDKIHSELAENFIYGIDARTGKRLGEDYKLQFNDVIQIVSSK